MSIDEQVAYHMGWFTQGMLAADTGECRAPLPVDGEEAGVSYAAGRAAYLAAEKAERERLLEQAKRNTAQRCAVADSRRKEEIRLAMRRHREHYCDCPMRSGYCTNCGADRDELHAHGEFPDGICLRCLWSVYEDDPTPDDDPKTITRKSESRKKRAGERDEMVRLRREGHSPGCISNMMYQTGECICCRGTGGRS